MLEEKKSLETSMASIVSAKSDLENDKIKLEVILFTGGSVRQNLMFCIAVSFQGELKESLESTERLKISLQELEERTKSNEAETLVRRYFYQIMYFIHLIPLIFLKGTN